MMPTWAQAILSAAAVITALGVLWTKVLNPLRRAGNKAEEMYPLLVNLVATFKDVPHAFDVLDEIIKQFRTNAGSSLRDAINRLEMAAQSNTEQSRLLAINVQSAKELAQRDREEVGRLILHLDRLAIKVDNQLGEIQSEAAVVAKNLSTSQGRADAVAEEGGPSGAAADMFSQSLPEDS